MRALPQPLSRLRRPRGGALALALTGLFAAPAAALEPLVLAQSAAPLEADPSDPARDAREIPRLLHLDDGRVLRGPARRAGERWIVATGGGALELDAARVVRVVSERRALARERELTGRIPPGDNAARIEHVRWQVREGLHEEALRKLDRVLESEPDHAVARELLEGIPVRYALPPLAEQALGLGAEPPPTASEDESRSDAFAESLERLVRFAARSPATVRERVVERLAETEHRERLTAALLAELVGPDPARRRFAALALRRLDPRDTDETRVLRLVRRAVLDVDDKVRRGAALALAALEQPDVVTPVARALASESPLVAMQAAEALGHMGYPAAVPALVAALPVVRARPAQGGGGSARGPAGHVHVGSQVAYVRDYDVEIAQGASIADPIVDVVTSGVVLDGRSMGVTTYTFVTHERVIARSLSRLTGEDPGDSPRAWERWWAEHGAEWAERGPREEP